MLLVICIWSMSSNRHNLLATCKAVTESRYRFWPLNRAKPALEVYSSSCVAFIHSFIISAVLRAVWRVGVATANRRTNNLIFKFSQRQKTLPNGRARTALDVWLFTTDKLAGWPAGWRPNGVKSCQLYPFPRPATQPLHPVNPIKFTTLTQWGQLQKRAAATASHKIKLAELWTSQRVFNNCIFNSRTKCNAYLPVYP